MIDKWKKDELDKVARLTESKDAYGYRIIETGKYRIIFINYTLSNWLLQYGVSSLMLTECRVSS